MLKYIKDFKAGDIVYYQGAVFRILEDARPVVAYHLWQRVNGKLQPMHGPVDTAQTRGEWLSGETVFGYFGPDCDPWVFQGNNRAGQYRVL